MRTLCHNVCSTVLLFCASASDSSYYTTVHTCVLSLPIIIVVVCVCLQGEVCSNVESTASDIQFPVEVTGGHMRPVVLLDKLDLTR